MRVSGLDLRDSGVVAVWWAGAGEHRAVLGLSAGQRVELVDRLLECLPGAAAHEQSLQVALGDVAQAGRSVAVHASGFEHSFGLVRPFALGDIDGEGFFYAGLRLSELGALDMTDVALSARRGRVTVRAGKGDAYRDVPLNSPCRTALDEWIAARTKQLIAHAAKGAGERETASEPSALWLSRSGTRMGTRAIDLVIRRLAAEAGLAISAHVLRHTCVTNLIRSGADVVMVAEIAGHRRLDTTRRYSLPSQADKDAALEAVVVET